MCDVYFHTLNMGKTASIKNPCRTFEIAPFYTTIILNISLRERPRHKHNFNDYKYWLVRLTLCLRWRFEYNENSQLNAINSNVTHCLWGIWGNQHYQKKAERDWTKVMVNNKNCQRVTKSLLLCIVNEIPLKLTAAVRLNGRFSRMISYSYRAV